MLVNLLARQFEIIHEIDVMLPGVPMITGVALFAAGETLDTSLVNLGTSVAGDAVRVRIPAEPRPAAVEVHVGIADEPLGPVDQFVRVVGCGWDVLVGHAAATCELSTSKNPFGPYFAACIGAGEVFKHVRGLKDGKGRFIEGLAVSLWDYRALGPEQTPPSGVDPVGLPLSPVYMIGAGAVGQAAAAVLAAARVRAHATIIDQGDEVIERTNLNRYVLATISDIDGSKAPLVGDFLRRAGLTVHASGEGWPKYAHAAPHTEQPPALQVLETEFKYEWVLSCVDDNRARHEIQSFWPRYIIGGSTDGLLVQVTGYDMRGPYECLKCANPLRMSRTIEDTAADLRTLSRQERRDKILKAGGDVEAIEGYLADPKCGQLGEQELERFRSDSNQEDWSVGFVSVASGVLLASQFIKLVVGGPDLAFPRDKGATLRFSFLNPGPSRSFHRRSDDCDCAGSGQREFSALWGST